MWIAYWAALATIMHLPRVPGPQVSFRMADKLVHFLAYFLLAMFGGWVSLRRRGQLTFRWAGTWFAIYAGYAALDELLQPLSNRHCELADWLADMAGVALAILICSALGKRARGRA